MMGTTGSPAVLSGEPRPQFATPEVREAELFEREQVAINRDAWERIENTLIEWGRDPAALEDEGFIPPSIDVINQACEVVRACRDNRPPPIQVVPDGEGGIAFEYSEGTWFQSLNIYANQSMELLTFDDCHLCNRLSLQ